jgi:hypothetical protein
MQCQFQYRWEIKFENQSKIYWLEEKMNIDINQVNIC